MKGRFSVLDILKKFDIFGEPTPSFNLGGRKAIKTSVGAIVSIIIFLTTCIFSVIKY